MLLGQRKNKDQGLDQVFRPSSFGAFVNLQTEMRSKKAQNESTFPFVDEMFI